MEKLSHLRLPSLVWIIITAIPLLIGAVLSSCRTQKVVTIPEVHTKDSTHNNLHKIVNNVYVRDSIYIREKGDTVYQDRWHVEIRDSIVTNTDTLRIVERDSIPYPVEVPVPVEVEKPIAPFCRWSTAILWIGLALAIGWRILKRRYPQVNIVSNILKWIKRIRAPV